MQFLGTTVFVVVKSYPRVPKLDMSPFITVYFASFVRQRRVFSKTSDMTSKGVCGDV
jgi:hypothetical protein